MKANAMRLVKGAKKLSRFWPQSPFHWNSLGGYDIDRDIARAQGRRHLEPDETRAEHNRAPRALRLGGDAAAIGQRAQIVHMREILAWKIEPHRLCAGSKQQRFIGKLRPAGKPQRAARH